MRSCVASAMLDWGNLPSAGMRDKNECGHTGTGGWLLSLVVAVLAVLSITPALAGQGLAPALVFLIVMLPLLGWALRLAVQTATVRLRLTEDGYLERRGTFLPVLRIPMRRVGRVPGGV